MKVDFDISGWDKDQSYEKFDVVFFSGDAETGCNPFESGYYYATAARQTQPLAQAGQMQNGLDLFQVRRLITRQYLLMLKLLKTLLETDITRYYLRVTII